MGNVGASFAAGGISLIIALILIVIGALLVTGTLASGSSWGHGIGIFLIIAGCFPGLFGLFAVGVGTTAKAVGVSDD